MTRDVDFGAWFAEDFVSRTSRGQLLQKHFYHKLATLLFSQ